MRVRLKLDRLHDLMARSNLSQNHWAIKIGMSRGHWSEIVNGKHVHPSPKTRERMMEVFGVSFDDLFEIEQAAPSGSDPAFQHSISDRYLIDDEIGQGGMGTVYLARDVKLGRQVAIKVLSPEAVSGIGVQQFLKEARYTARLQHQNILGLHDAGESAGHPYYVMPFIRGGSLRDLLERRGRLSLDEAMRIARGVAQALHYAHENHVLHCDIKPANILLGDNHVYVADFGIARAIHAEVFEWGKRVGIDSSAGTPAYVSPEQASGERDLDARADVYSFACVVYEMLAGKVPFKGRNTMETVTQRFTTEVPKLSDFATDIPYGVAACVERGMSLVPERRTASARELVIGLERGAARATGVVRVIQRAAYMADTALRYVGGNRAGRSRRILRGGFVEGLLQDIRQAFRTLRRAPTFTLMAILTLALGIGTNTAIFTVVNAVLLQPLPYERPEELVMIWELDNGGTLPFRDHEMTVAPANYVSWRERTNAFADLAAYNIWSGILSGEGPSERLRGSIVTPNLFPLLGIAPVLGSGFTSDHAVPGNDRVAILSHATWQSRFGGDRDVVGRTIRINGEPYEVLGVMPESYRHPEPSWLDEAQIFVPIAWADPLTRRGRYLRVLGRVRSGISLEDASSDLAGVAGQLGVEWPESNRGWSTIARPLRAELFGDTQRPLFMLMAAAGFVLLIVCANVANLVLARSHGRRKEFALRTALGAGRRRLARQLVAESVLFTLAGGVLGLAAVWAGTGVLRSIQGQYMSNVAEIAVDASVVVFMMSVALAAGVVFGLLPLVQSSRSDLRGPLTEESAGGGVSLRARRLRNGLVVTEVMLATVLVVGAGLMTRSFISLINVPPGFDTDRLLVFSVTLPSWRYQDGTSVSAFHDQFLPRIAGLPGVRDVALVSDLPFTTENRFNRINPLSDARPAGEGPFVEFRTVGPGYFRTMGISVLAGREFKPSDPPGDEMAVVVNQAMANEFWPTGAVLGERFRIEETGMATVIGIVGNVLDDGFAEAPDPMFYQPFSVQPQRRTALVLRSAIESASLAGAIRREGELLDGEALIGPVRPMNDVVFATVSDERVALAMGGVFSILALALAAVGIYGVMSYTVGERRREIGVRTALGAQRADVMRLVLGHSGMLTLLGSVGGIVLSLPLSRFLSAFLFGVGPADPVTLIGAPLVLAVVALVASYLPAAGATRISPVEALRSER